MSERARFCVGCGVLIVCLLTTIVAAHYGYLPP
jgi:hypothetical protein